MRRTVYSNLNTDHTRIYITYYKTCIAIVSVIIQEKNNKKNSKVFNKWIIAYTSLSKMWWRCFSYEICSKMLSPSSFAAPVGFIEKQYGCTSIDFALLFCILLNDIVDLAVSRHKICCSCSKFHGSRDHELKMGTQYIILLAITSRCNSLGWNRQFEKIK